MKRKKGQSGIEYLIVVGFITLAITTTLAASYFYVDLSKDKIKINQIEVLANKVINSAESVFYAGQPSQATVIIYVPENINNITIQGKNLIITASTSSGEMKRAFQSNVPIQGSIQESSGSKKLTIIAKSSYVEIQEN